MREGIFVSLFPLRRSTWVVREALRRLDGHSGSHPRPYTGEAADKDVIPSDGEYAQWPAAHDYTSGDGGAKIRNYSRETVTEPGS
jgi:hypothetical protein